MVKKTIAEFGGLDAAYNNAGIQNTLAETADSPRDDYDRVMSINLRGVWSCMKYELKLMREHRRPTEVLHAYLLLPNYLSCRSKVERLAAARSESKIDDALTCEPAMRDGNMRRGRHGGIVGIDCCVVGDARLQEFHRQMQSHTMTISDCAYIPVITTAPREHGIFADFAERHPGFVPNRG